MLATYFPLFTLTLLGDAPGASVLPAQQAFDVSALPHWLQVALMILGAVVPVASFVADFLDRYAKAKVARGEKIPAWLEAFGAAAHGAGANPRKAMKLAKSALGKVKS
jgi:hypothetical protein